MELADFFKFLNRQKYIILALPVLGLLIFVLYAKLMPVEYQGSLLIYVKREASKESQNYFNYDGYYALQTSEEYTDTVLGLVKSLDVLRRGSEITDHIPEDNQKLKALASNIKVTKKAPQLIEISVTDRDQEKSSEVVLALAQAAQDRIRILNQTGDKALSIDLVDPNVLILEKRLPALYLGILGTGLGLASGLILAVLADYLKTQKERIS